jgi:quercetin dioxygenase-like cupin family protein
VAAEPLIVPPPGSRSDEEARPAAIGQSFSVHEWRGSGPEYLHVHHADDEAWHVLEGTLRFKFADREVDAVAGSTVFVPAGVPHTYWTVGPARYLIILTPRLRELISALMNASGRDEHPAIMRRHQSEIVE